MLTFILIFVVIVILVALIGGVYKVVAWGPLTKHLIAAVLAIFILILLIELIMRITGSGSILIR